MIRNSFSACQSGFIFSKGILYAPNGTQWATSLRCPNRPKCEGSSHNGSICPKNRSGGVGFRMGLVPLPLKKVGCRFGFRGRLPPAASPNQNQPNIATVLPRPSNVRKPICCLPSDPFSNPSYPFPQKKSRLRRRNLPQPHKTWFMAMC